MTVKSLKKFLDKCNDDAEIYISQHTKDGKCTTIGWGLGFDVDTYKIEVNHDVVILRDYNILS